MTTDNKTTYRLKYLGVEMLKNDATKSSVPEIGLFRGLRERSSDDKKVIKLILVGTKDKENNLKALNLAVFNVLSMKMMYADTKELIVFKSSTADQEKAMELLEGALQEFQEEKRMVDNDPEIVDIKTFADVPKEFFTPEKKKDGGKSDTGNTYGYGAYGAVGSNYASGVYQNDDWKKKQEEREEEKKRQEKMRWTPSLINRGSELPGLKVLNAIKKKVMSIPAGEYKELLADPDPTDTVDADGKKVCIEGK